MINFESIKNITEHKNYQHLMYASCLLYAFGMLAFYDYDSLFKNILIFTILPYVIVNFNIIKKQFIFKLILVAIAIQIISWLYSLYLIPDVANSLPKLSRLTKIFFLLLISIGLSGSKKKISGLFLALILGFITAALIDNYHTESFTRGIIFGQRVDFNLHNAQYTSMLSVLIITTSFYIFKTYKNNLIRTSLIGIALFGLCVLVISQTRQIWLAFAITLLISPLLLRKIYNIKRLHLIFFYTFLLFSFYSSLQLDIVKKRINKESETISNVINMQWDNIPMKSTGVRIHSWIAAIDWIKKSPLVGQGHSAISQVIAQSDRFNTARLKRFGHLHNYYIETLVAYGIIGLLFYFAFLYHIYKNSMTHNDKDLLALSLVFLFFWLIINNFESYATKDLGVYAQNIMLGAIFSKYFTKQLRQAKEVEC